MPRLISSYDNTLFSSIQVMSSWTNHFGNPDAALLGLVTTAYNVAGVVCAFTIAPWVSDHYGRRIATFGAATLVFIGSFIMCFAPNLGVFIGGRVFVGAGTRMCLPSGSTLINELVYTNIRGRLMSFWANVLQCWCTPCFIYFSGWNILAATWIVAVAHGSDYSGHKSHHYLQYHFPGPRNATMVYAARSRG